MIFICVGCSVGCSSSCRPCTAQSIPLAAAARALQELRAIGLALPRLRDLCLFDPLWGACPLAGLPNYHTVALAVLPRVTCLDSLLVAPEAAAAAAATVRRKQVRWCVGGGAQRQRVAAVAHGNCWRSDYSGRNHYGTPTSLATADVLQHEITDAAALCQRPAGTCARRPRLAHSALRRGAATAAAGSRGPGAGRLRCSRGLRQQWGQP
jgi:hypothetical protein